MALAETNKIADLYGDGHKEKVAASLRALVEAPWMSSGLMLNNAFTVSLVIRAAGFLTHYNQLPPGSSLPRKDLWGLKKEKPAVTEETLQQLRSRRTELADFLYASISDRTRSGLAAGQPPEKLASHLAEDLLKIAQGSFIFCRGRFSETDVPLSAPTRYRVVQENIRLLETSYSELLPDFKDADLRTVAEELSSNFENFAVNNYPPSPAMAYWLVDGIKRAKLTIAEANWRELSRFARASFSKHYSRVLAKKDITMDPVALGMAACLCKQLTGLPIELGIDDKAKRELPSEDELRHAIGTVFDHMEDFGVWPKYFPMFHYLDEGAGSNYCFSFELLEAVVNEFGTPLWDDVSIVEKFERSIRWCELNRINEPGRAGWNSGGYIQTLEDRQPESWATAVVHMLLFELQDSLSDYLQDAVLAKYNAVKSAALNQERYHLSNSLDIKLAMGDGSTLAKVIEREFVEKKKRKTAASLRHGKRIAPTSALLFGPPGTSKSETMKTIAHELDWPLLTITPSEFVSGSLETIFLKVDEIFEDVKDLAAVVVFFDEMDALMQSRDEAAQLETVAQFLTTAMLPKLSDLHKKGHVLFFMATNHQEKFDAAIKRAGRFDLHICMAPPSREEKIKKIHRFADEDDPRLTEENLKSLQMLLEEFVGSCTPKDRAQLELLTYSEFKQFLKDALSTDSKPDTARLKTCLDAIGSTSPLSLSDIEGEELVALVDNLEKNRPIPKSMMTDDKLLKSALWRFFRDRAQSKLQY